jgi:alcohol dehydrogenase class IV
VISADWSFPTRIRIGAGRVAEVVDACREAGVDHPLVVTDTGLAESAMLDAVVDALTRGHLTHSVFAQVLSDPTDTDVVAGVRAFEQHGCTGVIALGGGSALDVGKLVALMAHRERSVWEFIDGADLDRLDRDRVRIAPVIAIPTTAGTGSEVGRAAVLTDAGQTKRVIFHPGMLPASVICDPELTTGLPRHLTVGTGMDALAHALEAYCAPGYHPAADGIATEAIGLVLEFLTVAANQPLDLHARQQMMAAALMGATAFQKGLGAMHALAHPVGARFGTHHGTTNAVVMPYVLEANREVIDARIDRLARSVGISGGFDGFLGRILRLRSDLGVPHRLTDMGVQASAVELIAQSACADPCAQTNPVPVTTEFARGVFLSACSGELAAPMPLLPPEG